MLKWTFQSPLFMRINLTQAIIGAALIIIFVVFFGWRAKGVILVTAIVAFGAGLWSNLAIMKYLSVSSISKNKFKELFSYSWPLLGLNIFAYFTRSLDRIFLASLASLSAAGIFAVSYTVSSVFEVLVSGFFFAWGPYILSTFKEEWAPKRYAHFFSFFSFIGIVSIILLGLWGRDLIRLFRPDGAYLEIGIFIPWIVAGILLYYLGGYFAPGPAILKKNYWKLIAFILAAITNGLLNYILIPRIGVLGACIATTISSLVAGCFNQIVSNRLYYVPNRWKLSFLIIICFTIATSTSQSYQFPYNILKLSFFLRILLTITLMLMALFPYYRDIKQAGLVKEFGGKIFNK